MCAVLSAAALCGAAGTYPAAQRGGLFESEFPGDGFLPGRRPSDSAILQTARTIPGSSLPDGPFPAAGGTAGLSGNTVPSFLLPLLEREYGSERGSELYFEQSSLVMIPRRQKKLTLNISPNISSKEVRFSSSDKSVAAVAKDGTVKSKKPGIAVITGTCDGHEAHAVVRVTSKSSGLKRKVRDRVAFYSDVADTDPAADRKRVVLAGSSALDRWGAAASALPQYEIVNTAVGGSTALEWRRLYKTLVLPYKPGAVVFLVGNNDIGKYGKITGKEAARRVTNLLKEVRNALGGDVPVFYCSMLISWNRKAVWKEEKLCNRFVRKFCEGEQNIYYIDLASKFLDSEGKPIKKLFAGDLLHPGRAGYALFKKYIGRALDRKLGQASWHTPGYQ